MISNHLSYHFWSKDYLAANADATRNGDVLLAIGLSQEYLRRFFESVRPVAVVEGHPLANPWNRDLTVFLCRRPMEPLQQLWPTQLRL